MRRLRQSLAACVLTSAAVIPAALALAGAPPAAAGGSPSVTAYAVAGAASVDTIGGSGAPWTLAQGDPNVTAPYTVGATTYGTGATLGTDASGVTGTPGPLAGYCTGSGESVSPETGQVSLQPGEQLPMQPYYFSSVHRNADGSLTGLFDYRPQDTDEAVVAAKSTDDGHTWTFMSEALEQNAGYCPNGNVTDDGEGHPFVMDVDGTSYLYTLQRAAGDEPGVGLIVHQLNPVGDNPIADLPESEPTGLGGSTAVATSNGVATSPTTTGSPAGTIPTLATSPSGVTVYATNSTALAGFEAPGRLYVDGATVYCTNDSAGGATASSPATFTGCTTTQPGGVVVHAGDAISTDPVVPPTSLGETSGLVSPDGILGVIPNSSGVPGATEVLYTEKILNYYDPTTLNTVGAKKFTYPASAGYSIPVASTANIPENTNGTYTIYLGTGSNTGNWNTLNAIGEITCGGIGVQGAATSVNPAGSPILTNCSLPVSTDPSNPNGVGVSTPNTSDVGIVGAAIAPPLALSLTGEGKMGPSSLFGNNEDLAEVRVAYTTNGTTFTDLGPTTGLGSPTSQSESVLRWIGADATIVHNPDGSLGMFSSGAFEDDGDSDAFHEIFYSSSSDGGFTWTTPTPLLTTDSTFSALANAAPGSPPANVSGYYSGRVYDPSVVENSNGSYSMIFSGYSTPKTLPTVGTALGSNGSDLYTPENQDLANYRTILTVELTRSTTPAVTTTTTIGSSADPGVTGQQVTYRATVAAPSGSPSGTVAFTDDGAALPGCSAVALDPTSTDGDTVTCPEAIAAAGSDTIVATYSGDGDFAASEGSLTQETDQDATSTSVASSGTPTVTGQAVTYTASVAASAPGAGTPTGSVSFFDGTTELACGAQQLAGGGATCTDSPPAAASDSITAVYSGDDNFSGSTSSAITQVIGPDATSTTVDVSPDGAVVGEPVAVTATVTASAPGAGTPTGTVSFSDGDRPIAGCQGVVLDGDATDTATCSTAFSSDETPAITATYGGDGSFDGSNGSVTGAAIRSDATTTELASSPNPGVVGQPVTYTATVAVSAPGIGTPAGTVEFTDDGTDVPGCSAVTLSGGSPDSAACTTSVVAAESDTVVASYSGDATDQASSSSGLSQSTDPASTTTGLAASTSAVVVGEPVTYTATVAAQSPGAGSPTGAVDFAAGGNSIPGCGAVALDGDPTDTATCTTSYDAPGSDTVTANFVGTSNYWGSGSGVVTATVAQDSTSTVLSSTTAFPGLSVVFTATVAPAAPGAGTATGTVRFLPALGSSPTTCSGGSVVPLSGGQATCTVRSGTWPIGTAITAAAVYSGDVADTASTAAPLVTDIVKDLTTTTVTSGTLTTGSGATFTVKVAKVAPEVAVPTGTVTVSFSTPYASSIACTGGDTLTLSKGGSASCKVLAGELIGSNSPVTVTASYPGDAKSAASLGTLAKSIAPIKVKATSSVFSPSPSLIDFEVKLAATSKAVAITPTGTVTWALASPSGAPITCIGDDTATLSGGIAICSVQQQQVAAVGTYSVSATYSGDADYLGATIGVPFSRA